MKKLTSLLTVALFALLLQNVSADPMGGPGPGGHPECPAGTTCGGPGDHHDGAEAACAAMGMADGSAHVDPPDNVLDQVKAEYEANCQSGNCSLGEGNYKLLEDMGHTRQKVDCFLAAGHARHDEQHGQGGPGPDGHPECPAGTTCDGAAGHHPPAGGPCPPDCGPPPGDAGHGGPPPGEMPPGMPGGNHDGPDCAALPTPGEVAACWDAKNHGGPGPMTGGPGGMPPGSMPPGGMPPGGMPPGGMP